jgi:hypothetical protein
MHTVIIRLSGEDFSTAIARMRDWLEKHSCEPTAYRYDQDEDTVVVSVDFAIEAQAQAFAKRFDGQSGDQPPRTSAADGPGVSSDHFANGASTITPLEDLQYPVPQSGETAPAT